MLTVLNAPSYYRPQFPTFSPPGSSHYGSGGGYARGYNSLTPIRQCSNPSGSCSEDATVSYSGSGMAGVNGQGSEHTDTGCVSRPLLPPDVSKFLNGKLVPGMKIKENCKWSAGNYFYMYAFNVFTNQYPNFAQSIFHIVLCWVASTCIVMTIIWLFTCMVSCLLIKVKFTLLVVLSVSYQQILLVGR
jgi:hypothetical protein